MMLDNFDKLIKVIGDHGVQLLVIGLCTSWILSELIDSFRSKK